MPERLVIEAIFIFKKIDWNVLRKEKRTFNNFYLFKEAYDIIPREAIWHNSTKTYS